MEVTPSKKYVEEPPHHCNGLADAREDNASSTQACDSIELYRPKKVVETNRKPV